VTRLRVGFAGSFSAHFADRVRAHLDVPCEVAQIDDAAILDRLPELDVVVPLAFTREMGVAARRLRLVQTPGAGVDRIDQAAIPPGAWLCNAYGHETGIAEYVMGGMLAACRGFGGLDRELRAGSWEGSWTWSAPAWPELSGKTVGILGYGRIGQAVARRARAFDMTVRGIRRDPAATADDGVTVSGPETLDALLRVADYLVVCLPLLPETRGLLDARALGLMKRSAVIVNVARAEIADEAALYRALRDGTIGGAVLDVWYRYPAERRPTWPSSQPFHELANVILTPHVAGWTEGTVEARARLIAANIGRIARGERPVNVVRAPSSEASG
jgi:phosphoglycerate dehydrogenase-like enzyme